MFYTSIILFVIYLVNTQATIYEGSIVPTISDNWYIGDESHKFHDLYANVVNNSNSITTNFLTTFNLKIGKIDRNDQSSYEDIIIWNHLYPYNISISLGNTTNKWQNTYTNNMKVNSIIVNNNDISFGSQISPLKKIITENIHWQESLITTGYYNVIAETSNVVVTNNTIVNITYSTINHDPSGAFSGGTEFVPPVKGLYRITLYASYDYGTTLNNGLRQINIIRSGFPIGGQMIMPSDVNTYALSTQALVILDTTDIIYTQLYAYSTASSLNADCYIVINLENGYA
jgi:hypothetical protein